MQPARIYYRTTSRLTPAPPPGQATRFPVPVDLTTDELLMAAEGSFVTRVIYVEDPQLALATASATDGQTNWIEARPGDDPLVTADALGRSRDDSMAALAALTIVEALAG